jgi:hypothetical protein
MKYPASFIVHWPSGPVCVCEKHMRALLGLAGVLGIHVGVDILFPDSECSNCRNEAEQRKLKKSASSYVKKEAKHDAE